MKNYKFILFAVGYLLVIAGVALRVFDVAWCKYVVVAGVALATVFRLLNLPKSDHRAVRHLNVQQLFCAAFQCLGAYMIWVGMTSWVLPFLISALADIWLSTAYSRYLEK